MRNQVKPQKDLKGFQCIFSSMNSHTWECHTVFQGKILIYRVTQQCPPYFEYIIHMSKNCLFTLQMICKVKICTLRMRCNFFKGKIPFSFLQCLQCASKADVILFLVNFFVLRLQHSIGTCQVQDTFLIFIGQILKTSKLDHRLHFSIHHLLLSKNTHKFQASK